MASEQHLKERIIECAWDRFRTDGIARVSIDDIASALVISKKTFYKVFESKEHLVEQIVARIMGEITSHLEKILQSNNSFIQKFSAVLSFMATVPSRVGFPLIYDIHRYLPNLWKRIEQFRAERVNTVFGQLLDEGIEQGYIRAEVNRRLFLLAYLAVVQNVMQPHVLANESFSAREALRDVMELFFTGALTEKGRSELSSVSMHESSFTF